MRTGPWLSVVLVAVTLLAACGGEPAEPAPREPAVAGPETRGLQMATRLEPERGLIRFDIENVSQEAIAYADYGVGHFGSVVLDVRPVGDETWTRLKPRESEYRFHYGMGPGPKNEARLEPGGLMPASTAGNLVDQRRFTSDGPLPGLDVPPAAEVFILDLLDFVWPSSWGDLDRGTFELRVGHVFGDWSEFMENPGWAGEVYSSVLRLDLERVPDAVRALFDRD